MINNEQRAWLSSRRKKHLRVLAVMLCLCVLFTTYPDILTVLSVFAVEEPEQSEVQILLDRIAELPDTQEYLTTEPDIEYDAETYAYVKWEEKLYEYTKEALAIWEEYEALTKEQQVMISEEESAKLTEWVELAGHPLDSVAMLTDNSAHHADWTALSDSDTELSGGNYYLADNIKMGKITITGEVTLCLNGKILEHLGDKGSVIVVGNGGTFTLCDCQDHWDYASAFDDGTGKYTYGITGTGGCIIGGKGDEERVQGGGVLVNSGNFIMESGRITGCDVYKNAANNVGGGVYVNGGGTFLMSGGFIDGNKATIGGGVAVSSPGTFTMSGNAVIMNNEGYGGVNVSANLEGGVIFNMNSGKILDNGFDDGKVGGVYFQGKNAAVFNMKGGSDRGKYCRLYCS